MKSLQKELQAANTKIGMINKIVASTKTVEKQMPYLRILMQDLDRLDSLININFRELRESMVEESSVLDIPYELLSEDDIIDVFITYNNLNSEIIIIPPSNTTIYPLDFPYSGVRGPRGKIEQVFTDYLGKAATTIIPFILGNEPQDIVQGEFKATSILKSPVSFDGTNTLIGIIDTGIDYTNPSFTNSDGETRIISIWDQTIGMDSPYGYGTVYDKEIIDRALKSSDPFEIVPHKDEWGHGTMLAGIAAGFGTYEKGIYKGVAPGAELVIVKLKPASHAMQSFFYGKYNPLGFSALDIALAFQFLINLANQIRKPISICLPSGTNSGSHDGTNILDSIILSYSSNPGVSTVISVGEEANKAHHASGDLKEAKEQSLKLTIAKGQVGFLAEIWAMFGDRIEVLLTPPKSEDDIPPSILLNENQTYRLSEDSSVWSQGIIFDVDTGAQVIHFRFENPMEGEWIIKVRGTVVIKGRYDIWIPKTGMILPGTVLSPASPFTTIYNTSSAAGVIAIGCYNEISLSACPSSGRGFTRSNEVCPDYIVDGVDIPGPLPGNRWGTISGTAPSGAITVGLTSHIYQNQLIQGDELANTIIMKAILSDQVKRQPTLSYPNPSSGYGVIDINSDLSQIGVKGYGI
ncbi:MAG TPA: S8 family peptidase [Epulopiscium sp.]|nr:S8 family peptidase [Candidatus Epulonipiscium sp.]